VIRVTRAGRGEKAQQCAPAAPKSALLRVGEPSLELGALDLSAVPDIRVWVLPDGSESSALFRPGFATLAHYGYLAKTGYFVWNREKHRYRTGKRPRANEVPLFWAHNVRTNERCVAQDGETPRLGSPRSLKAAARSFAPTRSSSSEPAIGGKSGG